MPKMASAEWRSSRAAAVIPVPELSSSKSRRRSSAEPDERQRQAPRSARLRRADGDHGLEHASMARAENARRAPGTPATAAMRRRPPSPFYARAVRIAAEPCGALVVREGAKALQLRTSSADHCGAGATGLEPATSGVTGRRSNQLSYAPRAPPENSALPPGPEPRPPRAQLAPTGEC